MTRAVSLFELATDVIRAHERTTPGRVTLIPVIVDDLEAALPVLNALALATEGRFLDCDATELQGPVPGTAEVVRRTAVETALTLVPHGGSRRVMLVDAPGGLTDATFADPPIGVDPSPGEKTILAIARAASHADLDRYPIAILAYRDTAIDLQFRRAVWNLVVDHLADLPHETLRTLVVVAESAIDIGLHCQPGRGFRFAVDEGRLLRRRGVDDLNAMVNHIVHRVEPFVLFLGAGFSASSRLPLGNGMRDGAIRRLLDIDSTALHPSDELAHRFHAWIASRDGWLTESEAAMQEDEYARQLTLEQVIRAEKRILPDLPSLTEFRAHHDANIATPGSAVEDLAVVLEHTVGRAIVVEVNFDRLVETHATVGLKPFSSDGQFNDAAAYVETYLGGTQTDIPLLKLHGDINDPDSCVVSAEQTELGVGNGKLAALRALLHRPPRLWIYIGVSMRDKDLVPVLRGADFARGIDELWVNPYLMDTIATFAEDRLPFWRERIDFPSIDDRIITETADAFFAAWRAAL